MSTEVRGAARYIGQADQSRTEAVCARRQPGTLRLHVRVDMHSPSTEERAGQSADLPVWCSECLVPVLSPEPP